MSEIKKISKSDWRSSFDLVGRVRIQDNTFDIDRVNAASTWQYSRMNMMVDCGAEYGTVRVNLMGGFGIDGRDNVIRARYKDDPKSELNINWEHRLDPDVLEDVADFNKFSVTLEKTVQGNPFSTEFVSEYDTIEYIKEHVHDGDVVYIHGNIKYSEYKDETRHELHLTSIELTNKTPDEFYARFTQSILLDDESVDMKKSLNDDNTAWIIDGMVLDYRKELNGVEIRSQYPYPQQFEFVLDDKRKAHAKSIYDALFKVKKGKVNQITFKGHFVNKGATVKMTLADCSEEYRNFVEWGIKSEEDAIRECATTGSFEEKMIIDSTYSRKIKNDDGTERTESQIFPEKYDEEDLMFDVEEVVTDNEIEKPDNIESTDVDDLSWLEL